MKAVDRDVPVLHEYLVLPARAAVKSVA